MHEKKERCFRNGAWVIIIGFCYGLKTLLSSFCTHLYGKERRRRWKAGVMTRQNKKRKKKHLFFSPPWLLSGPYSFWSSIPAPEFEMVAEEAKVIIGTPWWNDILKKRERKRRRNASGRQGKEEGKLLPYPQSLYARDVVNTQRWCEHRTFCKSVFFLSCRVSPSMPGRSRPRRPRLCANGSVRNGIRNFGGNRGLSLFK